jgi:hypothetical protein
MSEANEGINNKQRMLQFEGNAVQYTVSRTANVYYMKATSFTTYRNRTG